MVKDPVCDMDIDVKTATQRSEYDGHSYYFCSALCKDRFDKEPERYLIPTLTELQRAKRATRIKNKQAE